MSQHDVIKSDGQLVGVDGNAFAIMGTVRKDLRRAGNPPEVIDAIIEDMMSGDYDHLLAVASSCYEDGGF